MMGSSGSTVKPSAISRENYYAFVILNVLDGVFSQRMFVVDLTRNALEVPYSYCPLNYKPILQV